MKKNIKLKILIIVLIIFASFFIIIKNINLSNSKNLFIDFQSISSFIENNKTGIIYDYLKYRDKVYCIDYNNNLSEKNKTYINNHFPSIKFINKFQFFLYSKLFKQKIMCYVNDFNLIEYRFKY